MVFMQSSTQSPPFCSLTRFVLSLLGGALAGFALFLCIDYVQVRWVAPGDHIGTLDWLLLIYPLVLFAVDFFVMRRRIALAIVGSVLSCEAAVILIVFFGIPFHFAIGGELCL